MTTLVAVVLLAGIALAPGALGQDSGGSGKELTFTVGSANDVDSMNPFVGVEAPAYFMYALNYDLLVGFDQEDNSPAPSIAESWETSEDGLTWTFQIRDDITWSDGEPLTSEDVEYTYQRVLDEKQGCCIDYIELIDTMETPDDTTLIIHTKKPFPQLVSAFVYILPEHVWSEISEKEAKTFENYPNPVTSGPFHLSDWQKGQFFTMEANEDYWAGAPKVDAVTYRVFNNQDAVVQALKAGEVDFADGLTASPFNSLKGEPNVQTHEANISSFDEIGFNTGADDVYPKSDGHPALKDVEVRQAISHAIDKQTIVDRVLQGYGVVGESVVPEFSEAFHWEPTEEEKYEFDLDVANQILDDAGYEDTDGDGVREMPGGGRPLEFRYFIRSENVDTQKTSQFVTGWLEDIGIETKVQALTDTKLTDVIYEGNYDMFHWGWFPDVDPSFILSIFTCDERPPQGIWSDSFYCDPELDRMYNRQKTLIDQEERIELVKDIQKEIYEAAPYVVLYYDKTLQAYNDRWTGFRPQPDPDGDLLSDYSFVSLRPVSAGEAGDQTRGISPLVWVAIVAGLIVVGLVAMMLRRRVGQEDRA
jgi:peptide/nickel transport system substrate-binding protein